MKEQVTQEFYQFIRDIEEQTEEKIASEGLVLFLPMQVNEIWGVYQVHRCFKSASRYYADLTMLEKATDKENAAQRVGRIVMELEETGDLILIKKGEDL